MDPGSPLLQRTPAWGFATGESRASVGSVPREGLLAGRRLLTLEDVVFSDQGFPYHRCGPLEGCIRVPVERRLSGMEDSMEWSGDPASGGIVMGGGKNFSPAPSYESVNRLSSLAHPTEGGGEGSSGGGVLDPHRSTEEMLADGGGSVASSGDPSTAGSEGDSSTGACSGSAVGRATTADTAGEAAAGGEEFLCYECGLDFRSVKDLQLHMVRKTAWSNQGLIGCRVSCLVDNREWHEGLVTQVRRERGRLHPAEMSVLL